MSGLDQRRVTTRCDTLVVGGGLLGCAVAWHLASRGSDVLLLEQQQVNAYASGQNAGSLHFQLEYRMIEHGMEAARCAAEAMPLHLDAARAWAELASELGEDVGVRLSGGLMLAESAEEVRLLEAKAQLERSWGLDVEMVEGDELRTLAPYLDRRIAAAAYCPAEGKADARLAAPAFARAAASRGAHIWTQARLEALELSGGRWRGRCTVAGTRHVVDAEAVVIAAGVWTADIARTLGVELPAEPVALTMSATAPAPPIVPHLIQHVGRRLSLKQVDDGNLLIGGGWPARLPRQDNGDVDLGARPVVERASLAANARAAMRVVPETASLAVVRVWTGMTTLLPDQLPLLGPLPRRPGIFVATGGSAFTLGPTFARVLADLVGGAEPQFDIAPYAPTRFGQVTHA